MSNTSVTQTLLTKIRLKRATTNDVVVWFDSMQWGGGPIFASNAKTYLLPVLQEMKTYQPNLLSHIEYPGDGTLTVIDNNGARHVIDPGAVSDPGLGERIKDFLKNAPIISQALTLEEAQLKILQFLANPVRVWETVIGAVLIAVGINALLKGKPASAARKVATVTPVGRVAAERRVARRGAATTARVREREAIKKTGSTERAEIRRSASYQAAYAKEAGKSTARENAAIIRAARNNS